MTPLGPERRAGGTDRRSLDGAIGTDACRRAGVQTSGKMTAMEPMVVLFEQGMLLESARGPIPNVAELVAGEPIRGSWWSHPSSHAIFEVLNVLADSPDVVRTRLVKGR